VVRFPRPDPKGAQEPALARAQDRVAARLGYRRQDSRQTLAEGLEDYYRANLGRVTRPSDLPGDSAELFRSHDLCHVIFGLTAAPDDEAMADTRTLLSCDVGAGRYFACLATNTEAQKIFKEFGYLRSVWVSIAAMPRICRAIAETRRMRKRWPWTPPESFQNRSLADLREEFGVRVV